MNDLIYKVLNFVAAKLRGTFLFLNVVNSIAFFDLDVKGLDELLNQHVLSMILLL